MTEVGFPCAITFYSISGNFDKILLKIAFNTNIKYILKLITYAVSFSAMMRKMCIILLIPLILIILETLEISYLPLPIRFLVVACNKMNLKFVQIR